MSLLTIFLGFQLFVFPQEVTLSGFIIDKSSGEKIIGATVYEPNQQKGTVTNQFGYYSLELPSPGLIELTVSHVSYQQGEIDTIVQADTRLNIYLESGKYLEEVQITWKGDKSVSRGITHALPIQTIKKLPSLGSETDIMKTFQLLPGVKTGTEGTSALHVRGGSHDQNLVLLDDVPLYYINHLGGFVSAFNSDAINNVTLTKGGFPARHGSRLSSIMEVRMKDGHKKNIQGSVTLGPLLSKASLEGPLKKDTSNFMISGRRFMYDLLARPLSKILFKGVSVGYHFYDVNAKISRQLDHRNQLYLSLYQGDDKFLMNYEEKDMDVKTRYSIAWGNFLAAGRWNHVYGPELFSNVTAYFTRYRYNNKSLFMDSKPVFLEKTMHFDSRITDYSLKGDWDYYPGSVFSFKFGGQFTYHIFKPGATAYESTAGDEGAGNNSFGDTGFASLENALYLENILQGPRGFDMNLGIRAFHYFIESKSFFRLSPRLIMEKELGKGKAINASFAIMQQPVHLLASPAIGLPRDLWLPATAKVPPAYSYMGSIGFKMPLKNGAQLASDVYYKKMHGLIAYKEGIPFMVSSENWEEQLETNGKGFSYGIECMISKSHGPHEYFVTYTYSKAKREFQGINNGRLYNYKYDRPHDISFVYQYNFNQNISLSGTWVFYSGEAITMPTGKFLIMDDSEDNNAVELINEGVIYPGKNVCRLKPYHRMDIGLRFEKEKPNGKRTWAINVYNFYNRQNPFYYYFEQQYDEDLNITGTKLMQQSIFPVLPTVSYRFEFR